MEKRLALDQTVVTAVVATRACLAGGDVVVQPPTVTAGELAYWRETVQESDAPMEHAHRRRLELLPPLAPRPAYQKRTAMALAIAPHLAAAGHVPQAH